MRDHGGIEASLAGLRILIVEDEVLVSFFLDHLLTEIGCRVEARASSNNEALALINGAGSPMDGAIVDVELGSESCEPTIEALRRRRIPFIIAAASFGDDLGRKFGCAPLLLKPYTAQQLRTALWEHVAARCALSFGNGQSQEGSSENVVRTPSSTPDGSCSETAGPGATELLRKVAWAIAEAWWRRRSYNTGRTTEIKSSIEYADQFWKEWFQEAQAGLKVTGRWLGI